MLPRNLISVISLIKRNDPKIHVLDVSSIPFKTKKVRNDHASRQRFLEALSQNDYITHIIWHEETDPILVQQANKLLEENVEKIKENTTRKLQEIYRRKRLHTYTEKTIGLYPEKQSNRNIIKLIRQLKDSKNKKPQDTSSASSLTPLQDAFKDVLMPEEFSLFKFVLDDLNLTIRHESKYFDEITTTGKMLLSLEERKRRKLTIQNSHTTGRHGRHDNVYFSIGSKNHNSGFGSEDAYVIQYHLPKRSSKPDNEIRGLWFGEHTTGNDSSFLEFGTTKRHVMTVGKNGNEIITTVTYYYMNGKKFVRELKSPDDTVAYGDLRTFFALKLIEELRYIGDPYRTHVLSNPSPVVVEAFIDQIFCYPFYDAKIPVKFDLNQPSINVRPKYTSVEKKNAEAMHLAAKQGDTAQLSALIKSGVDVDILKDKETPLMTAILHNQIAAANFLLRNNANPSEVLIGAFAHGGSYFTNHVLGMRKKLHADPFITVLPDPNKHIYGHTSATQAAQEGDISLLKKLINHGAVMTDSIGTVALVNAINNDKTDMANYLLDNFAIDLELSVPVIFVSPMTPLLCAIENAGNNLEIIKKLLLKGANPNTPSKGNSRLFLNNGGETPLIKAITLGKVEVVKLLIEKGADITCTNLSGYNALDLVLKKIRLLKNQNKSSMLLLTNLIKIQKILEDANLKPNINFNNPPPEIKNTEEVGIALIKITDKSDQICFLLGKKYDENGKSEKYVLPGGGKEPEDGNLGVTAAREAFEETSIPISRLLKENRCRKKKIYSYAKANTPLKIEDDGMDPVNFCKYHVVEFYLYEIDDISGIPVRACDDLGEVKWVREDEIRFNRYPVEECNDVLIQAVLDNENNFDKPTLDYIYEKMEIFFDGPNQLYNAVKANNISEVARLLESGTLPDKKTDAGGLPLIAACEKGNQLIIDMLLAKQANPNLCSDANLGNRYPLIMAIAHGDESLVLKLIRHGADINLKTRFVYSPVCMALLCGHFKLADLLITKGADHSQTLSGICDFLRYKLFDKLILKNKYKDENANLIISSRIILAFEFLLKKGVDINHFCEEGKQKVTLVTAIQSKAGHDIIQYLLASGADPRERDHIGQNAHDVNFKRTPLSSPKSYFRLNCLMRAAVVCNDFDKVVELMSENKSAVNANQLNVLFQIAVKMKNDKAANYLGKHLLKLIIEEKLSIKITSIESRLTDNNEPTVHIYCDNQNSANKLVKFTNSTLHSTSDNKYYVRLGVNRLRSLFKTTIGNESIGDSLFQVLAKLTSNPAAFFAGNKTVNKPDTNLAVTSKTVLKTSRT